ncbi:MULTISPECIES: hypothetical protein [unclassified Kitasatospora]|uniref:hypothetical protein n=1 Tax=unclassified Kitasatospora TaxID=2633591 RepID=UPI00381E07FD
MPGGDGRAVRRLLARFAELAAIADLYALRDAPSEVHFEPGACRRGRRCRRPPRPPLLTADRAGATTAARSLADRLAAAYRLDRLAAAYRLDRVVYRNGARMPVRAWAEAALAARSAVAHNTGTLNTAREYGIHQVEVSDGHDCGWNSHPDPDKATRTLRTVEEAADWPISHPRCARTFGLSPDASDAPGEDSAVTAP